MPLTRRRFASLVFSAPWMALVPARAATTPPPAFQPFSQDAFTAAMGTDTPLFIHVAASWSLISSQQTDVLLRLMRERKYAGATFLRVDYDAQREAAADLNAMVATLIGYKRGRVMSRMTGDASEEIILKVLNATYGPTPT